MSMTREEAIKWLEETIQDTDTYWESCSEALQKELDEQKEVFLLALTALRPVSREQVEKVWRGEWVGVPSMGVYDTVCSKCGYCPGIRFWSSDFCPHCGAPMTDEAVQMVMRRLEAMYGEAKAD
ncbi:MAG TPA: hypothetical protein IAB55_06560 [Candidatus Merdivicinus faecavium]|nr:hypothetical protein [Candidatus Merdivicinus faecavium]